MSFRARRFRHVQAIAAIAMAVAAVGQLSHVRARQPTPSTTVDRRDWLVDGRDFIARVERDEPARTLTITNGLIRRTFSTARQIATRDLRSIPSGEPLLVAPSPEARLSIDGRRFAIGGSSSADAEADPFSIARIVEGRTAARFPWRRRDAWLATNPAWPAPGVSVAFELAAAAGHGVDGLAMTMHYELFDGLPVISKWITLHNASTRAMVVDGFVVEELAVRAGGPSPSDGKGLASAGDGRPLHLQTDMAFGGAMNAAADNPAVRWQDDDGASRVTVRPPIGPAVTLRPGDRFESFRVFELLHDGGDVERRGLAIRRMTRAMAPWVLENPLIFHVRRSDPTAVRAAIQQAADTGFEMIILSFGSRLSMERTDDAYLDTMRTLAREAHQKGIALGGYSLLASRKISPEDDVIDRETGQPDRGARFLASPCLGSRWAERYFASLYRFLDVTRFDILEHDGSYPGDSCASTSHPGHAGFADSQWTQWRRITALYRWARARGIYLTVPDWYFLSGSSRIGMGYTEDDWSRPRDEQELIERQNIFDGTWEKTPSMGWMHVPLEQYHGGGAAATVEPLDANLAHYERRLANLFGAGVTGVFRGSRLFDTPRTQAAVRRWVAFYKQHRAILNGDIIHLRRPDGKDYDAILHVESSLPEPGLLMIYNPLSTPIDREIAVPLYYTGLRGRTHVRERGAREPTVLALDAEAVVRLRVHLPARGSTWFTFSEASHAPPTR